MPDPRIEILESALAVRRAELSAAFHATDAGLRDIVPAGGRWSIAMVIEHLSQTEQAVTKALAAMVASTVPRTEGEPFDAEAFAKHLDMPAFLDRTRKLTGRQPTGTMTALEAWEALTASREALREVMARAGGLRLEDLRRDHPMDGTLDGYQWMAFVGLHEARHAVQIAEIRERLSSPIAVRPFDEADVPEVWELWTSSEGVGFGPGDTPEGTIQFLRANPGLSLVATEGDRIVAATLCGQDGRRGYVYHLAVAASHRRKGIGADLVRRCLAALSERGIGRCSIVVYATNSDARAFWEKIGGRLRGDLVTYSLETGP